MDGDAVLKRVFAAFVLSLLMAIPAHAGRTGFAVFLDDCLENNDRRNAYLAWVPGTYIWCYTSNDGQTIGHAEVLKRCNTGFRQRFSVSGIACSLLYDGRRVVDPIFASMRKGRPAIPMTIGIYDAATEKLQTARGFYHETPPSGDRSFSDPVPFKIEADGIVLCTGSFRSREGLVNQFTATCFGTEFQGQSRPGKFALTKGIYTPVPKVTRLINANSWIEFRF
jgi:hypothetical protein